MENQDRVHQQFESLLLEAIDKNHCCGVDRLLSFEATSVSLKNLRKKKTSSVLPLVLALERRNTKIINMFHRYQYTVPEPHANYCRCQQCKENKLGQARLTVLILKTLSNPLWMRWSSDDPFLTLFEICLVNKQQYKGYNDSFRKQYTDMHKENETLCLGLLDEIRTQTEGAILMNHKSSKNMAQHCSLSFVQVALDHNQKEVVAHSVVQHFVTTTIFDDIPYWESSGCLYKVFLLSLIALLWPITTALSILCPFKPCAPLEDISSKPFVKFVNGLASYVTFKVLLVSYATERASPGIYRSPSLLELLIFVFLSGFCARDLTQMYRKGVIRYFTSPSGCINIGMDVSILFAAVVWQVMGSSGDIPTSIERVADGVFALGLVLSCFRFFQLCCVSRRVAMLQVCMSEMVIWILHTALFCICILITFAFSMFFITNASIQHNASSHNTTSLGGNFWIIVRGLTHTTLSMPQQQQQKGISVKTPQEHGLLLDIWVNVLNVWYACMLLLVFLNLVVFFVRYTHPETSQRLSTEQVFLRTSTWLEYMNDSQTYPIPFNLLPTRRQTLSFVRASLRRFNIALSTNKLPLWCTDGVGSGGCSRGGDAVLGGLGVRENLVVDEERRYKEVCDRLLQRYLHRALGLSYRHIMAVHHHDSGINQRDAFVNKIEQHIDQWRQSGKIPDLSL